MDRVREMLSRITDLSDDELTELRDLILRAAEGRTNPPSGQVVGEAAIEELEVLASAATAVKRESQRREQNVTRGHDAQQILASFRREPLSRAGAIVPADRRPRFSSGGTARALTASGMAVPDKGSLADEFVSALRTHQALSGGNGEKVRVATLRAERGPNRTLRISDSAESVANALEVAADQQALSAIEAITAAGGLGAPEDTDYALPGFEVTERPVKSSLPTFTAERGGIRLIRPPALGDLQGAVGIWNVASDVDAVNNPAVRKPSLRVVPNGEVVVNVQAVTNILTFGNMLARAYPEFVQRVMDLALAAHAKIAEQQLLTQLGALSTSVTGQAQEGGGLGATRVLLPLLDRAATGMRNRLRTDPNAPLQLILPAWARGLLRSNLALQEPGDSTVGVSDADLAAYLATRNLAPTWALDGEAGQEFNPQAAGPVNGWPTEVVSYMFPAGGVRLPRRRNARPGSGARQHAERGQRLLDVHRDVRGRDLPRRRGVPHRPGPHSVGHRPRGRARSLMGRRDPRCEFPGCTYIAVPVQPMCVQHGGTRQARTYMNAPVDHMRLCGARRRDGGNCTQPAMRGQERCRMHGGSAPMARTKAVERIAEAQAVGLANRLGIPRSISAVDALQEELNRTQGRIDWLESELAQRPNDGAVLAVYTAERGHLRQLAGGMVSSKTDERRSMLNEQTVDALEAAITGIVRDLGHDPHTTRVRDVVARHLRAVAEPTRPRAGWSWMRRSSATNRCRRLWPSS
ncbi:major capsid protein [Blastococcus sp. VKM Ac-2987]|uniref:major capsid protein n=1 Tax=Blastococcus sp. VKM Ac-2987 TaxID=3004141 RepID=UPI0022AB9E05|nr:major capsid protein [Blastococcus sp. VKM Ac-2987]MCZ2857823.1 major capsid protein [Blastococcus sp. VKM Ac-2987]